VAIQDCCHVMALLSVLSICRSLAQLQTLRKTRKHCFLEGIYKGPSDNTLLPRGGQHSAETSRHEANLALSRVGTVDPVGMACPPLRTVLTPLSVYGSPSLKNVLEAVLFNRAAFACPTFPAWHPRTVSLPLSDSLSSVLPRLIRWLIQILWLLNPLQANVGYSGDSVAIQVFTLKRSTSLGNPAFQHE
jgi:hypothetical protein